MNRYTELTCKFWPHYNILVGSVNFIVSGAYVIYWVDPIAFYIFGTASGLFCIYWGIQGLIHHRHMKKLLTKHSQGV